MDQKQKPRLRFAERIEELHEQDSDDSGQFGTIFRILFLPGLIVAGVAAIVSVLAWLKMSLSPWAPLMAGGVVVAALAILVIWRRSRAG